MSILLSFTQEETKLKQLSEYKIIWLEKIIWNVYFYELNFGYFYCT